MTYSSKPAPARGQTRASSNELQSRLEQLVAVDEEQGRGSISDRVFFENNPQRRYRMRLATPAEIATATLIGWSPPTNDRFLWVCVHHLRPGVRLRLSVTAPMPAGGMLLNDIPEEVARDIYQTAVGPQS